MIERLVLHPRVVVGGRLGKIEVIMLFGWGMGALNSECALCVFGTMHVLAYGLEYVRKNPAC